jgi:hypothetical protein
MGQVALILDPQAGVAEIRIIPHPETRFEDKGLFWFASRLGPTVQALDEALRAAKLGETPRAAVGIQCSET